MAIRLLKDVPADELAGKFVCLPSLINDQAHGYPAVIEKVTKSRLSCVRLPRGEWDSAIKEWQVSPTFEGQEPDERREAPKVCNLTSIKFVCDEAWEAIALYTEAQATRKAIEALRKQMLAAVDANALASQLSMPEYLLGKA